MGRKFDWIPSRRKSFTEKQRLELAKLDNAILRAFPSSPRQRELQTKREKLETKYSIAKKNPRRKTPRRKYHKKSVSRSVRVLRRNPVSRAPKRYLVEALVRTGERRFTYRFWNGRTFITKREEAETFGNKFTAYAAAKRIMPYCASKVLSLRAVPA